MISEVTAGIEKWNLNKDLPVIEINVVNDIYADSTGYKWKKIPAENRERFKRIVKRTVGDGASSALWPAVSYVNYYGSSSYTVNMDMVGIATDIETYRKALDSFQETFEKAGFGLPSGKPASGVAHHGKPMMIKVGVDEAKNYYGGTAAKKIDTGLKRHAYWEFYAPMVRRIGKIRDSHSWVKIIDAARKAGELTDADRSHKKFGLKLQGGGEKTVEFSLSETSKKTGSGVVRVYERRKGFGGTKIVSYNPYGELPLTNIDFFTKVGAILTAMEKSLE